MGRHGKRWIKNVVSRLVSTLLGLAPVQTIRSRHNYTSSPYIAVSSFSYHVSRYKGTTSSFSLKAVSLFSYCKSTFDIIFELERFLYLTLLMLTLIASWLLSQNEADNFWSSSTQECKKQMSCQSC